ncbi:hypothetical protein D3C80_1789880 [compost metagenome]
MGDQISHSSHDFGDSGLVICTQQSGAVCCNQRVAFVFRQLREAGRGQDDIQLRVQYNIPAVIIFNDLGLHIGTGKIRCRIEMGQESDRRHFLIGVRSQSSHYIGMLVHGNFR